MDVAVPGDSQQFEELALATAKEKAGLVRKRLGDEKADVLCRCTLYLNKSLSSMMFTLTNKGGWRF